MMIDDEELTNRAVSAYFRDGERRGIVMDQPAADSGVVQLDGETFVELHNANGTLAMYRVLDGANPSIRRVPVEDWPTEYRPV